MKKLFIPAVLSGFLLVGCSSAYRTGQTPDDVYYSSSPTVPVAKAQATIAQNDESVPADGEYQSYWGNSDDNYLKMKVQNGGRWNSIDDNSYWNGYAYNNGVTFNPYMYNYNYSAFNSYNPWGYQNYGNYWGHNSWYNGYGYPYGYAALGYGFGSGFGYGSYNNYYGGGGYYPVIVVNKNPVYYNPSRPSLAGYSNNTYYNRSNGRSVAVPAQQSRSLFRSVFSGQSNGSNAGGNVGNSSTVDRPARTFNTTPSSSTPASSGSSSSGGSTRSSGSSSSGRGGRGG